MPDPKPMPDTVVFDLGGVLIDWNPRHLYRKLIASEAEMEWFLQDVCTGEWNEQMDAGYPFAQGIADKVAEFPQHADWIRAFFDRWEEMIGGALEETVVILEELKHRKTPLYVLSNWSAETFSVAHQRFEFLQWFDGLLVSGEEGLKKPDPAIFQRLLEKFQLPAERCVFIDDREDNTAVAQAAGMTGIRFQNADQLRQDLVQLGLL